MDGKELLRRLRQLMTEQNDSDWLDEQTSYDFLYEAARQLVDRTNCLRSSQDITTVAEDDEYDLNPDFLKLYAKNKSGNYYVILNDGSNNHYLTFKDYEDILYDNNTSSVAIPSRFSIIDASRPATVSGTATSDGAADSNTQECTLNNTTGQFSTFASTGDIVHNVTDGSNGIVMGIDSNTAITTRLFNGTNNDWTNGDSYYIVSQGRYQIYLDPPPSTAGYTLTIPYIQSPYPVYSAFRSYRFSWQYHEALIKYAFWLYKYRDEEPNFGDSMYKFWEMEMGRKAHSVNRGQRPGGFKVNLKKRQ